MKEKSKLTIEAIEAFKVRYGELPADAGWPVVRELEGSVYFARSKGDWIGYAMDYYRFGAIVKAIYLLLFVAVVVTTGLCLYCGSFMPLIWGVAAYVTVGVLAVYVVSAYFFARKKANESEIKEYNGYKKKFYSITM